MAENYCLTRKYIGAGMTELAAIERKFQKMKILIDTNIFHDFYRSKNESLRILSKLTENSESIILTEQIVNEFYRNRTKLLREVKKVFDSESNVDSITSSFLDSLPDYQDFLQTHNQYKQKRQNIKHKIDEIISNISIDPVASEFKQFVDKKITTEGIWPTSNSAIEKAQKRKYLGNPPNSEKYSIGDEINWEVIIENSTDDIVIVGRDKTYNDNFEFLRYEFHKKTGKFINLLTTRISEAFTFIGKDADQLTELENKQLEELREYSEYWKHLNE